MDAACILGFPDEYDCHRVNSDRQVTLASDPEDLHVILLATRISCDQGQILAMGLRDQHPVEGVRVDPRQPAGGHRMGDANRKLPETAIADAFGQIRRPDDLAERLLDSDLPNRGSADADIRLL